MLVNSKLKQSIPNFNLRQYSGEEVDFFFVKSLKSKYFSDPIFLQPHRKDFFLLAYSRSGSGRYWVDTTSFNIAPNTIHCFAPGQVQCREELMIDGFLLAFTTDFLSIKGNEELLELTILKNLKNGHRIQLSDSGNNDIEKLFEKMLLEFSNPLAFQFEMLSAHIKELLIGASRLHIEQYREKPDIKVNALHQEFQSLVDVHFKQIHVVFEYAELMNLSPNYLNEIVKNCTGKSALMHIHSRLGLEAKRLLYHTDRSSKEIAYELGFRYDAYFSRFFKRFVGQSPLDYRAAIRKTYQ